MVQRKEYLDQLINWKDEQVIKVVTGIRHCGKSTLLMQFQQWLKENGVTQEQIVSVNFEELEYEDLLEQVHEASEAEIAEYGVYNSEE